MNPSFNLIDQPWIPCITSEGEFVEVSLRGLLARAHKLREISCETPIMSASILPLTLAILHRNFGPANTREWGKLWSAGKFNMPTLDSYFDKWYPRFDLFHPEQPFYQAEEKHTPPSSLIHIIHTSGNTATLFNHNNEFAGVEISPAKAAHQLLASRLFHTGGTGPSAGKGRGRYYFKDSSFARGVIFWARGENLFETLMFNLIRYTDEYPMLNTAQDMPAWEMDNSFEHRKAPHGYLDYLTWSNNRIKLIPEMDSGGVYVHKATVVPTLELSKDFISPQKRHNKVIKRKETTYPPLRFTREKALWRDYHSLLPQDNNDLLPATIRWCARLADYGQLEDSHVIQLMATGMATDPGKAKIYFYRREVMPLPLKLLRKEEYVSDIAGALKRAEEVAGKLRNALNTLAEHVLQRGAEGRPDTTDRRNLVTQWNALGRFWIELEPRFWDFIEELVADSDQVIDQWEDDLKGIALASLRHAIKLAGDSPWAWKGGIVAERQLRAALNKLFNK